MYPSVSRTLRLLPLLPLLAVPGFAARGVGELDPTFAPVKGITAQTLPLANGKIIALGDYTGDPDGSGVTLVRFNSSGTTDSAFAASFNDFNISLRRFRVDSKGRIIVAGGIPKGQSTAPTFARLLDTGRADTSFKLGVEGMPTNFVVQGDDRFIFNGRPQTQIFGFTTVFTRVNADGSPDTAYLTDGSTLSAVATDMALTADGKLVALGYISSFAAGAGFSNHLLTRLNANGSTDSSFHAPDALDLATYGTDKLAIQADGKLLISAVKRSADLSKADAFLVRYRSDGSPDGSFKSPKFAAATSAGPITRVEAITPQSNGKILIGGIFGSVNGTARTNIARLNADGSLDTTFVSPKEFQSGTDLQVIDLQLQADGNLLVAGKLYATLDAQNLATIYGLVRLKNDAGGTNPPPTNTKTSDLQCTLGRVKVKVGPAKTLLKSNVVVRNAGRKKARGVTATAHLSADGILDEGDTILGNIDLATAGAGKLGKNAASEPVPFRFKLPANTSVTGKYLLVMVDPDDTVDESDETNNVAKFGPLP